MALSKSKRKGVTKKMGFRDFKGDYLPGGGDTASQDLASANVGLIFESINSIKPICATIP